MYLTLSGWSWTLPASTDNIFSFTTALLIRIFIKYRKPKAKKDTPKVNFDNSPAKNFALIFYTIFGIVAGLAITHSLEKLNDSLKTLIH